MRRGFSLSLLAVTALVASGCGARLSAESSEGPGSPPPPAPKSQVRSQPFHGLTVEEAEDLVSDWIKANVKGDVYWHEKPSLKDATPKEVGERLKAQVFRLVDYTGSVDEADAYLLRDRQVFPLCVGFGGSGLGSLVVCDLDGNGEPELAYTYSWGSGLHRSHLELLTLDNSKPTRLAAPFVVRDVDLVLSKSSDRSVELYVARGEGQGGVLLGSLTLTQSDQGLQFDVEFDKSLPKKWSDLVLRSKSYRWPNSTLWNPS